MENRKNYQKILENQLEIIKKSGKKPKLLIHACCGPCFTIPFEILRDYFDITIMYNNSNIYPKEEHDRRLAELKKYLEEREKEVIDIMLTLFDQETATRNFMTSAIKENTLTTIKSLMKTMKWSPTEAMNAMEIPASQQSIYAAQL